jgi:hypothetical protein
MKNRIKILIVGFGGVSSQMLKSALKKNGLI